jgi:hypothetical protein
MRSHHDATTSEHTTILEIAKLTLVSALPNIEGNEFPRLQYQAQGAQTDERNDTADQVQRHAKVNGRSLVSVGAELCQPHLLWPRSKNRILFCGRLDRKPQTKVGVPDSTTRWARMLFSSTVAKGTEMLVRPDERHSNLRAYHCATVQKTVFQRML